MNHDPSLHVEFLAGEKVYLRPVEPDDCPLFHCWANDPETRSLTGETRPSTLAATQEYYEQIQKAADRVWLAVVERETRRVVGETGLLRMFPAWRTTDWSLIIGDPQARGKGYGREAALLMLDYAFGYQNFHRVSIGVVGFNTGALRFYERLGFKQEGVQQDGYYSGHRYYDFVMMRLLEEEFRQKWGEWSRQGAFHST
jgi:RimJ/RimL family protein N-acetyltransferase